MARKVSAASPGTRQRGDRYVTKGPPPTVWEHDCGTELHPQTVCAHCGQPVTPGSARLVRVGAVR